jgi:hypothetical protein
VRERRTKAVIWKWKASFFVQPTTLHQAVPLHHPDISLAVIHPSPQSNSSLPTVRPVVQAHLITAKVYYFLDLARAPNTKVNRPTRAHWPQQTSGHHYCRLPPSAVAYTHTSLSWDRQQHLLFHHANAILHHKHRQNPSLKSSPQSSRAIRQRPSPPTPDLLDVCRQQD